MQTNRKEIIATADGSPSLFLPELKETYHSRHGAQTESDYVFLQKGLSHWLDLSDKSKSIHLLEVGFGTGLNAYLTFKAAVKQKLSIHYHSLEKFPLSISLLEQMQFDQFLGATASQSYFWPLHQAEWEVSTAISANFHLCKKEVGFEDFRTEQKYDIIFYDAFGAHAQPQMWTAERMAQAANLLRSGGVWVSYCAKGSVRRALEDAGLQVERLPGPPGKREMLRAIRP
ncbi:MAG: tRNA (5-methylaminomethyl-2-thiouridine)(34)-methyltransferase MnmD [Flavobacteriaceae bacterium]